MSVAAVTFSDGPTNAALGAAVGIVVGTPTTGAGTFEGESDIPSEGTLEGTVDSILKDIAVALGLGDKVGIVDMIGVVMMFELGDELGLNDTVGDVVGASVTMLEGGELGALVIGIGVWTGRLVGGKVGIGVLIKTTGAVRGIKIGRKVGRKVGAGIKLTVELVGEKVLGSGVVLLLLLGTLVFSSCAFTAIVTNMIKNRIVFDFDVMIF